MIISGGVNIYPAEIEAVIYEHPGILDVAVFGIPDDEWGERVHAIVQAKPGVTLDLDELRAFVDERLGGYKRPRAYEVRDELPAHRVGQAAQARAARRVLERTRDRGLMRGRALVAGVLLVAAAVALVVAFTAGGPGSNAEAQVGPGAATPLWSVRRVPEPVVEAVGAQHLQAALDAAAPGDGTCFVVSAGNHTLATHGADTPLIGASTQKILVAAAALSILGPDSTFQTRAVSSGPPADGRVDQLWLVGGGDPVLATGDYASFLQSQPKSKGDVTTSLESLADAIVAKGVQAIPGGVVGDDSRYDEQRYLPTWKDTLPHRRRDRSDQCPHRERRVQHLVAGAQGARRRSHAQRRGRAHRSPEVAWRAGGRAEHRSRAG